MPGKRTAPVAVAAVTGVVVVATWVSWFAGGLTVGDAAESYLLTNSAMSVTFTAFGALVLAHRPRHRVGLLFVAYGACYTVSAWRAWARCRVRSRCHLAGNARST